MKINNVPGPIGVYRQTGTRRVAAGQEAVRPGKSDEVTLSPEAQQALAVKDKIAQTPEVRQQRVEELKRQIQAGTYNPDAREVAVRMLKSRVFDDLA
jgi:negative regulator of flagellin synthesis FlgM